MSLLDEKNLRQIYNSSKVIPLAKFNIFFPVFISLLCILSFLLADLDVKSTYDKIDQLLNFLFSPLLTLLGFLIAGYTIFCTITPVDLQVKMANFTDKQTKLSFFKKIHFTFIRVFIYFLFFCFLLLIIFLFKDINLKIIKNLDILKNIYLSINYVVLSVLIYGTVFLFCELSSFIFNIYTAIAQTLKWEIDKK